MKLLFFMICEDFLSTCLLEIANLSFWTGIFPDLYKVAKVIPIFLKKDPLLCQNYRPISLLPIYSKIVEELLYTRMYSFLEKNKLLNQNQFGFRQNHSTSHTLINLTETIKRQLDGKKLVAGVFIDLEKAFDTVNHSILCNKLKHYGFRGKINELILPFLSSRRQHVSIKG